MLANGALTYHDGSCCRCKATADLVRISEFGKALCPHCYPGFVQRRVELTVRRFRMIPRRSHVAVALSGGTDSGALLHILREATRRLNFRLTALHVDMGLGDYSACSLAVSREQAERAHVTLEVDAVTRHGVQVAPLEGRPVCAVCGAVRRCLLPRLARRVGADVLCTGHTLDDQLQFMLKNILSGHLSCPAPVLPGTAGWPTKVKPLIMIPEVGTKTYARLLGIPTVADPCPHFDPASHRFKAVFDLLEQEAPLGKLQFWSILRQAMRGRPEDEVAEHPCPRCGEPTHMTLCPLCRLREAQRPVVRL